MSYYREHHDRCKCEPCEGERLTLLHIPNACLFDLDYNRGQNVTPRKERDDRPMGSAHY